MKIPCPVCKGRRVVVVYGEPSEVRCTKCEGTGEIEDPRIQQEAELRVRVIRIPKL